MITVIDKLIPILMLFALGHYLAKRQLFSDEAMQSLRKFVINVALTATLFKVFIEMELKQEYLLLVILTTVLMGLLYTVGSLVGRIPKVNQPLAGFVSSGFAFGTLGIPLFIIIFGVENLGAHSIYGLGHEFFIWFFYINLIKLKLGHEKLTWRFLLNMIKSPLIIAVFLGLTFNLLGLSKLIQEGPIFSGIYTGITYISQMITPLILIIVGYNLKFEKHYMKQAAILAGIRLVVVGVVSSLFLVLVLNQFVVLDQMMVYGYIVFMLLSPPTSLALFVGESAKDEHLQHIANNAVVLYTMISMVLFTIFVVVLTLNGLI